MAALPATCGGGALTGPTSGPSATGHQRALALGLALSLALLLRVGIAAALPNILWPDEVFQSVEQAHRLAFGYGVVPWEFRVGARSWLFPGVLAGIMRVASWIAPGAGTYLGAVAFALAALSLAPIVVAYAWARRAGASLTASISAAFVCAAWFELVFFASKPLTEVVAAHLLLAGLYLVLAPGGAPSPRRARAGGALLALAVVLRLQLALAAAVGALWAARRGEGRRGFPMLVGAIPVVLGAGLLDAITWSYPFQSFVQSLWINLGQGRSRMYGVLPWDAYLTIAARVWAWAGLLIVPLALVGSRRRPALLAVAAAALLPHLFVAHKEYRFVYPVVMLVILLAALGTADLVSFVARRSSASAATALAAVVVATWAFVSAARGTRFGMVDTLPLDASAGSAWSRLRSTREAFEVLGDDPGLCGVGLVGLRWYHTPGYSGLHRNVPIYEARDAADANAMMPHVNFLLAAPGVADRARAAYCWQDGVCLVRVRNGCDPDGAYSLNARLTGLDE